MEQCVGLIQHIRIMRLWKRLFLLARAVWKTTSVRAHTKENISLTKMLGSYTRLFNIARCHLCLRNLLHLMFFGVVSVIKAFCRKIPEMLINNAVTCVPSKPGVFMLLHKRSLYLMKGMRGFVVISVLSWLEPVPCSPWRGSRAQGAGIKPLCRSGCHTWSQKHKWGIKVVCRSKGAEPGYPVSYRSQTFVVPRALSGTAGSPLCRSQLAAVCSRSVLLCSRRAAGGSRGARAKGPGQDC